jgi:hypothetical protein
MRRALFLRIVFGCKILRWPQVSECRAFRTSRDTHHFFSNAVQFSTTIIGVAPGAPAPTPGVMMRNFFQSAVTS